MKKLIVLAALFFAIPVHSQILNVPPGGGNFYNGYLVNAPVYVATTTFTLDLAPYKASKIAFQVNYSSAIPAQVQWQDGSVSTETMTVASYLGLSSATATDRVTIVSTTSLIGSVLTVAGYNIVGVANGATGLKFNVVGTTTGTAVSLANAIALIPGLITSTTTAAKSSVVYSTAAYGSFYNSYTMVSNNSSMTVTSPKFQNGQDNAVITINGVTLTQGQQFNAVTSIGQTGVNIAAAINTAFSGVLVSTSQNGTGVVYTTSVLNGSAYNYGITVSTPALTIYNPTFLFGSNPQFSLGGNVIMATSTFVNGEPVLYSTGAFSGTAGIIGGLTAQTTYFVHVPTSGQIELTKYSTSALAGSPSSDFITFTSTTSQLLLNIHTFALTPMVTSGNATLQIQSSNDNINWINGFSSILSTGTYTITTWAQPAQTIGSDFGVYNYRYIRLTATPPPVGAMFLQVPVTIKQDGIGPF